MGMARGPSLTRWVPLGTVASLTSGLALSGRSPAGKGAERVRAISVGDIQDGRVRDGSLSEIVVEHLAKVERYLVEPGDVLVACRGTQPKVFLVPANLAGVVVTSTLIDIRPRGGLLPEVLTAYLRSAKGQQALLSHMRSATGQIALTVADVAEMEVPVPPIEEQERLAELVRTANAYYIAAIEGAGLRRDIAYRFVVDAIVAEQDAVYEVVKSG